MSDNKKQKRRQVNFKKKTQANLPWWRTGWYWRSASFHWQVKLSVIFIKNTETCIYECFRHTAVNHKTKWVTSCSQYVYFNLLKYTNIRVNPGHAKYSYNSNLVSLSLQLFYVHTNYLLDMFDWSLSLILISSSSDRLTRNKEKLGVVHIVQSMLPNTMD